MLKVKDYVEVLIGSDRNDPNVGFDGRRGRVLNLDVSVGGRQGTKVQLDGDAAPVTIPTSQLFLFQNDHDSFMRHREQIGPQNIEDLYRRKPDLLCSDPFHLAIYHRSAKDLESWYPADEVKAFIASKGAFHGLQLYLMDSVFSLGLWIHGNEEFSNVTFAFSSICPGCASLREMPEHAKGRRVREPPLELSLPSGSMLTDEHGLDFSDQLPVDLLVHSTMTTMELMCTLLARHDADNLLPLHDNPLLLLKHMLDEDEAEEDDEELNVSYTQCIVSFISDSSLQLPKLAEIGMGLLSLMFIKHPTHMLTSTFGMDHHLARSVVKYVSSMQPWWGLSRQERRELQRSAKKNRSAKYSDNEYAKAFYSAKLIIDMLPVLYHLGTWRREHENAHQRLTHMLFDALMFLTSKGARYDHAPNAHQQSLLMHVSPMYMEPLLACEDDDPEAGSWRQEILRERHLSFAIAGIVEVFGWWFYKSCSLYYSDEQTEMFRKCMQFMLRHLRPLTERTPRLSFIIPILETL